MLGTLRLNCDQLSGSVPASLLSIKSFGPARMYLLHIDSNQVCKPLTGLCTPAQIR